MACWRMRLAESRISSQFDSSASHHSFEALPNKKVFTQQEGEEEEEEEEEAMPLLHRCCCLWDTRKGSIIVGIYSMVMAVVGAVLIILSLVFWDFLLHNMKNSFHRAGVDPGDWFYKLVYIGNIVALVVVAFYVFVCLVMIHGIRQDKHTLLLPWITWTGMIVVFGILSLVLQIAFGAVHSETLYLMALVFVLLVFLFWVYCLIVVVSQYQVLKGR